MIDVISAADLRLLAEADDGYCVSMFLPTHRSGSETAQDPIRLKNSLTRALSEMETLGARRGDAERLLAPVTALEQDSGFWAHAELGLAVFAGPRVTRLFRLPIPIEELVVVADRFHIRPLLPLVAAGEVFHVLALSPKHVRLLHGSRFGVNEMALGDIPATQAEVLRFSDREAQLQSHAAGRVGTGGVTATFHGQGAGKDTHDSDLDQFLVAVDAGLRKMLAGDHPPVVLAGVADTLSRYRNLSKYPNLVEASIEGSVQPLTAAELHERAWPLVEAVFDQRQQRARHAFSDGLGHSTNTVTDTVRAALEGRVATLFVPLGVHRWGRLDTAAGMVEDHQERRPGDRDLLDVAAMETLANGGEVFAVEEADVPGEGPLAALLRY